MKPFRQGWLRFGFTVPFLAVGLPYWLPPYTGQCPDTLLTPGLALVALPGRGPRQCEDHSP